MLAQPEIIKNSETINNFNLRIGLFYHLAKISQGNAYSSSGRRMIVPSMK
jgi:hypothetical protein